MRCTARAAALRLAMAALAPLGIPLAATPARAEVVLVFPDAADTTWVQNETGRVRQAYPPGVFGESGWIPGSAVRAEILDTPCPSQPAGPLFCDRVRLLASFVAFASDPDGGCCGQGGRVVFQRGVLLRIEYDEADLGKTQQEDQIGVYTWDLDRYLWTKLPAEIDAEANVIRLVQVEPAPYYVVTVGLPPWSPTTAYTTWGGLLRLFE